MKTFVIVPAVFATSGAASTVGILNTQHSSTLSLTNTANLNSLDLEISDKHIQEIENIDALKQQQKIKELDVENIDNFISADTGFNAYYHTMINATDEKSNIITSRNSNSISQKTLQDLWKKQINLANEKDIYTQINTYVSDTSKVSKALWETVKDSSKTTTTPSAECKIQKKVSPPATSPEPYDVCSADWQIITIKFEDKITQLLSDNSVTPSPADLLSRFQQIQPKP